MVLARQANSTSTMPMVPVRELMAVTRCSESLPATHSRTSAASPTGVLP